MAILVQHGHGKSDKLDESLGAGTVDGVVFAPRNEKPANLASCIQSLANAHNCELLIDPKFYISAFAPAKTRYLTEYAYFQGGLSASDYTLRRIRSFVSATIDYQISLEGVPKVHAARFVPPTV